MNLLTWVTLSEVEVGEVDNIVVALLGLVEEPELGGPACHVVSHHTLDNISMNRGR